MTDEDEVLASITAELAALATIDRIADKLQELENIQFRGAATTDEIQQVLAAVASEVSPQFAANRRRKRVMEMGLN